MTDLQPRSHYSRLTRSNSVALVGKLLLGSSLFWGQVGCGSENGAPSLSPLSPIVHTPASLDALTLSSGQLNPTFDPAVTSYSTMFIGTNTLVLTPIAAGQTITVDGTTVASGSPSSPIALTPGTSTIPITVTSSTGQTKTYTIVAHQLGQEAYTKASNTTGGDQFGASVAADETTLVVGAPLEDSSATGVNGNQSDNTAGSSGAVYVFTRTGSTWTQQAYLKASNTGVGDQFGISVALDGDTLAVGAIFEDSATTGVGGDEADNSAENSGAVYVFTRTGTNWAQQAYIKASNTGAGDQFGTNVALAGDTLAIGAQMEDSNGTGVNSGAEGDNSASNSGAVYIFARTGSTWTQQAYIKAFNSGAGDEFGRSVALSGDTLAVGAYREDSNGAGVNSGAEADDSVTDSGAVYVFTRTGSTWTQQAYIKASNASANYRLGFAIALEGDTLVAGSSGEDSGSTGVGGDQLNTSAADSGAVYVFTRNGSTWSQHAYVKASNTQAGDQFGVSVAISGDTLVVGASTEDSIGTGVNGGAETDNSAPDSGAVYVLR